MNIQKLAIIGFGKRVQGTILPALVYNQNKIQLSTIYTRKKTQIADSIVSQHNVDSHTSNLKDFQPENYQFVYFGIPSTQLLSVIETIVTQYDNLKHLNVILDTPFPIGKNPFQVFKLAKLLRKFRTHTVLEDCIYLEPYAHSSPVSQSMKLGKPRFSHFLHSGFRYHAYSQIKAFHHIKNFNFVVRLKKHPCSQQLIFHKFRHVATITEPRNYTYGQFSFWYEDGIYSDFITNESSEGLVNLLVDPKIVDNKLIAFNIKTNGEDVYEIPLCDKIPVDKKDIKYSIWKITKINAVSILLGSIISDDKKIYNTVDCVYDSLVDIFVRRIGFFFDIPIPLTNSTILYEILKKMFK